MNDTNISRRGALHAGLAAAALAASAVHTTAQAQQGKRRTYVLVHGAWYGGWVWQPVADGLRAMGHKVYAPSLSGLGTNRHMLRPGINLDNHADDIVNLIQMEDLDQVTLVGWSYGGMVVADVLGRIPQKIASMIYLDAFVPERGRSVASYTVTNGNPDGLVQLAAQGKDLPVLAAQALGVNDTKVAEFIAPRVAPFHPIQTFLQASKAPATRPDIPHTYVLAGGYAAMRPTFVPFHKAAQEDRRWDAQVLNTSHVMMLTDVEGTLRILANAK